LNGVDVELSLKEKLNEWIDWEELLLEVVEVGWRGIIETELGIFGKLLTESSLAIGWGKLLNVLPVKL
jgi:hypothetical protein